MEKNKLIFSITLIFIGLNIILLVVFALLTTTNFRLDVSGFEKVVDSETNDVYYQKNGGKIVLDLDDYFYEETRELVYPVDNYKYIFKARYTLDERKIISIDLTDPFGTQKTCTIASTNPDYEFPETICFVNQAKKDFFYKEGIKILDSYEKNIPWYVRKSEIEK